MSSSVEQSRARERVGEVFQGPQSGHLMRGTERAVSKIEAKTSLRVWAVRAEAAVASEKMRQVDRAATVALAGQATLRSMLHVLSGGDPLLADELNSFAAIARMGKIRVLSNLIERYDGEGLL